MIAFNAQLSATLLAIALALAPAGTSMAQEGSTSPDGGAGAPTASAAIAPEKPGLGPLPAAAPPDPAAPASTAVPPAPGGDISGTYAFDPEHSQVMFAFDHLGLSTSRGLVNGVAGSVTLDEKDPEKSSVEASFPLAAIRTASPALDGQLMGGDFFKGASGDTLVTFRSTGVERDGDGAKVTGDLTLNGVTRPLTLDVQMTRASAHPMTGKPAAGFRAKARIKRSDFKLGAFAPAVSDEIAIEIAVEASKG